MYPNCKNYREAIKSEQKVQKHRLCNFCSSVGEINRAKECSGHCVLHAWDKPYGDSFIHCSPQLKNTIGI